MNAVKSSPSAPPRRGPITGVLAFLAVVLAIANLLLLSTREPAGGLPRAQRDEDAFRLAGLTARSHPRTEAAGAVQMTYTVGDRCGTPLGLALIGQIGRRNEPVEPETQLWFTLTRAPEILRTPGAPAPPGVTLVRHELLSDLVEAGSPQRLELELSDLGVPSPTGEGTLVIDNLQGPAADTSAAAPSPSLANMVEGSHCRFQEHDLETFALLARSLRARICDDLREPGSRCYDSALTIFRDADADAYRLDLRTLGEDHGLLHLRLEILRDPSGRPVKGTYRILPHSSLAKTANLFFTRPRPRGELLLSSDPGFSGLRYLPPITPQQLGDHRVELKLLTETKER